MQNTREGASRVPTRPSPNVSADSLQISPTVPIAANVEKDLRAPIGRSAAAVQATERVLQRESFRTFPTCTLAAGLVISPAPRKQLTQSIFEAWHKKSIKDSVQTQTADEFSQAGVPRTINAGSTQSDVRARSSLASSSKIFPVVGADQRQSPATNQGGSSTSDRRPTSISKGQQTAGQVPASDASGSQRPNASGRHPLDANEHKRQSETPTDHQRLKSWGDLARPSLRAGPSTSQSGSGIRTINLGIETEFYLGSRDIKSLEDDLADFVAFLTRSYNAKVPQQHPRMRLDLRPYGLKGDYDRWCIVRDGTMSTPHSPWGLELVSPVFKAFPFSTWRKDVEAVWKFLQSHYNILGSEHCATHIHISIEPKNTLQDSKRIAQAAIHFETALEALMPPYRRGNDFAKSNWLDGSRLGQEGLSRHESIAAIEKVSHVGGLVYLMQNFDYGTDRNYAWNFQSLQFYPKTIEFRKPPVSLTPDAALSWAELALSFVHASVRCESSQLQKVPPTVGGLRWFLRQFYVPGMNEPARLERLWKGKDPRAAVEPIPLPEGTREEIAVMKARLHMLAATDKRQILAFAETTREPYW